MPSASAIGSFPSIGAIGKLFARFEIEQSGHKMMHKCLKRGDVGADQGKVKLNGAVNDETTGYTIIILSEKVSDYLVRST